MSEYPYIVEGAFLSELLKRGLISNSIYASYSKDRNPPTEEELANLKLYDAGLLSAQSVLEKAGFAEDTVINSIKGEKMNAQNNENVEKIELDFDRLTWLYDRGLLSAGTLMSRVGLDYAYESVLRDEERNEIFKDKCGCDKSPSTTSTQCCNVDQCCKTEKVEKTEECVGGSENESSPLPSVEQLSDYFTYEGKQQDLQAAIGRRPGVARVEVEGEQKLVIIEDTSPQFKREIENKTVEFANEQEFKDFMEKRPDLQSEEGYQKIQDLIATEKERKLIWKKNEMGKMELYKNGEIIATQG